MTTAFVLSGGGNLGAVQVGMLQALADAGIHPDVLVGTSVGAVNAGWVAAGCDRASLDRLEEIWCGLQRSDVFPLGLLEGFLGFIGRRDHLVSNEPLRRLVSTHLRFRRLEDAPIPLTVIAADVLSGTERALSSGDATTAILASAAIPGVFPPVEIDGRPLIDGGVVDDTPVSHAVRAGVDVVYALPTGFSCSLSEAPSSALAMVLHGIGILASQRLVNDIERYRGAGVDLRVVPPPCPVDVSPIDFSHTRELIERGRASAAAWLEAGMPPVRAEVTLQL
ncbi:MAG: patatin-like phospholipase family protein [Actinomyces sp.]|nr:MAG: patatin-like phospholipase family protein [Actinomyces sp.]